jgi:hypothetical protein
LNLYLYGRLHWALPPDTDTYMAMQANHAYLVGIVHEWLEDPSAFCLLQKAEAMVDMFIAGLRACPPRISAGCNAQAAPARQLLKAGAASGANAFRPIQNKKHRTLTG